MNSPVHALLWRCWQLSWRQLLLQQILAITMVSITLGVFNTEADYVIRTAGVNGIVFLSLTILLSVFAGRSATGGRSINGAGYPFTDDFVKPLSIPGLLFIQLCYCAVLVTVAYAVPLFVLGSIFAVDGPQLLIALLIAGGVLLILSMGWWTTNMAIHTSGWILILLLFWEGSLFPSLTITENPFVVSLTSPASGLGFIILISVSIVILLLGVQRQRRGENLFISGQQAFFGRDNFTLGRILPFLSSDCPTSSPLKAELWRQQQRSGLHLAIAVGLIAGLALLILLRVISIIRAEDIQAGDIPTEGLLILTINFGLMAFMVLSVSAFGIRIRNRVTYISTFEMTTPISTAKMAAIKLGQSMLNVLVAWLALVLIIWIFGPLIVNNFAGYTIPILELLRAIWPQSIIDSSLIVIQLSAALFTATIWFASLSAWCSLWPRLISTLFPALVAYGFLLFIALALLTEQSEYVNIRNWVVLQHLWLFIAAVPIALILLFTSIMRDQVLNTRQLTYGLVFFSLLASLVLYFMNTSGLYDSELAFVVRAAMSVVSLLPLTALALGLWTMNQIRHR